jgi:ribonucleoside-diphosphate reductase alpha chain
MVKFHKQVLSLRNILPGKAQGEEVSDDELFGLFDLVSERLFPADLVRREELRELIYARKVTIGTSILTNINSSQSLNACTVLNTDLHQDFNTIKKEIELSSMVGMGVGFSLDSVDDPGQELYKLNQILNNVNKKCRRPVAGITNLDASHPKVMDYIEAKREADFGRFKFNISVSASDDFMHGIINSTASAKDNDIFSAIAENMHYCGEPGLLFLERMQNQNPVPDIKFESFSPCAELPMGKGEACQFSYINLSQMIIKDSCGNKVINWDLIEFASRILTRSLDAAVQISIDNAVFDTKVLSSKRRIGIGVCGYADLLIELGVCYGSKEGNALLQDILSLMNFSSKEESMHLAAEKGTFSAFASSKYMTDSQFIMRFSQQGSIALDNWQELHKDILKLGLRNSSTIALPPTGNSSLLVGASNSIEPHFSLIRPFGKAPIKAAVKFIQQQTHWSEEKKLEIVTALKNGDNKNLLATDNFLSELFRTATEITPQEHLSVVIAAQPCIDDAISKTINMHNAAAPVEVAEILKQAYQGGVKGISVFREGCLSERKSFKQGDVVAGNSRLN